MYKKYFLYLSLLYGFLLLAPYCMAKPPQGNYTLNEAKTTVDILVFKGGVLSSLGHNHVVSVDKIQGALDFNTKNPLKSKFRLTIPIRSLIIDDPDSRNRYPKYFSNPISARSKQATRHNMLKKIFNAQSYPLITIKSLSIQGRSPNYKVYFWLTINGIKKRIAINVTQIKKGVSLTVKGNTTLNLEHFGIKPFSAALGTISIRPVLRVYFDIHFSMN